jgi:MFS family permease
MSEESTSQQTGASRSEAQIGGRYSWYVLIVLVLVYMFNFIDRQILSILNEDIKADLGLTDAQMGFLFGTAFAVFYALFGIPLGRLADIWVRKSIIAMGLSFWSVMTALSGTARGFASLATFRIGVGVGESSASPAAFSLLGDYFSPRMRATAVAVYSSGVYIGAGVGMLIGGQIVDRWNRAFPEAAEAPFGLVGWQAAFFAVGLPGLLMAVWVWTLKEPVRGQSEGLAAPEPHRAPFKELGRELGAVLPPFTLFSLAANGAGARGVVTNLAIAAAFAAAAWGLTEWVGSAVQWIALGIGLYSFFSWVQGLKLRDPATFELIYRCKSMIYGMIGFAWCAFVGYGAGYWAAPFFQRVHGESAARVGTTLGLTAMAAGWLGVTLGGVVSDWLKARTPRARLYCGVFASAASIPAALVLFTTPNVQQAYVVNFVFQLFSSFWIGSAVALANELVVPRMRATASAYYILAVTFIGLALGPFTIGQISTSLEQAGRASGEALRSGVLYGVGGYVLAIVFLLIAMRTVEADESGRLDRARAAGEEV